MCNCATVQRLTLMSVHNLIYKNFSNAILSSSTVREKKSVSDSLGMALQIFSALHCYQFERIWKKATIQTAHVLKFVVFACSKKTFDAQSVVSKKKCIPV